MDSFDFVCISLLPRQDRRDKIQKVFEKLGIADKIKWWIVQKHPDGGIHGCFESHYSVWTCPEFTQSYLCIFEDDMSLNDLDATRFQDVLQYTQSRGNKSSIINLEPSLGYKDRVVSAPNLQLWTGGFLHLGCYILDRHILKDLAWLIRPYYGMDIDTALYNVWTQLGVFPPIFSQNPEDSDNSGGHRNIPGTKYVGAAYKRLVGSSKLFGRFNMEMAKAFSNVIVTLQNPPQLKDRRVK